MKKYIAVVVLLLLFMGVEGLRKTGALRMCDKTDCELSLKLDSSQYRFFIYKSNLLRYNYFVFCLRERDVTQTDNNNCELGGLTNNYICFSISPTVDPTASYGVSSATVSQWTSGPDITSTPTSKTAYTGVVTLDSQIQINMNSLLGITSLNDISSASSKPKIYEIYAGYQDALQLNTAETKNAFFHTFRIINQTDSDDLFMQRNPVCFIFFSQSYYNYNLVFYGGAIRDTNQTMYFHVLSYLQNVNGSFPTDANLNAWIGLSLSQSHAGRDMFAFITANSTLMDLYSLYYHSPFLDESPNVNGYYDLQQVGDSNTYTKGKTTFYYWGGLQRLYYTGDVSGDENIIKKMNNTYCLGIGYSTLNNSYPYSPILQANKHDNYQCWASTIQLWEIYHLLSLLAAVMLLAL